MPKQKYKPRETHQECLKLILLLTPVPAPGPDSTSLLHQTNLHHLSKVETQDNLLYSLLGVPSLSAVSEGRSRGSSFRSLSGVAALSSARSSAALMSLRRESSGLLSCPVIIGSCREWRAQVGKREERIKKKNPALVRCASATSHPHRLLLSVSTHSLHTAFYCSLITLPLSPAPSLSSSLFYLRLVLPRWYCRLLPGVELLRMAWLYHYTLQS